MNKETKRKPIIGILPSVEPTNKMTKVNYGYTNGIIKHGGIPMIFTFVLMVFAVLMVTIRVVFLLRELNLRR